MKTLLRIEEAAQLLLSIYLFSRLDYAWWLYPALFFLPDASLLLYLLGQRSGVTVYNVIHHKALALALYMLGGLLGQPPAMLAALILFGHASMDRMLGFGLHETNPARQAQAAHTA